MIVCVIDVYGNIGKRFFFFLMPELLKRKIFIRDAKAKEGDKFYNVTEYVSFCLYILRIFENILIYTNFFRNLNNL